MNLGSTSFLFNILLSPYSVSKSESWRFPILGDQILAFAQKYKIASIEIQNHSSPQLCWFDGLWSYWNLILTYFVFKSVGGFRFSHSNQFAELAKGANIDQRLAEPNYFNEIVFSENSDPPCQIVDEFIFTMHKRVLRTGLLLKAEQIFHKLN